MTGRQQERDRTRQSHGSSEGDAAPKTHEQCVQEVGVKVIHTEK